MNQHIEQRIKLEAESGLMTPFDVFENNLGLVSLSAFKHILASECDPKLLEVILKLQELVYVYREKLRTIYFLIEEDNLKIDWELEKEKLDKEFSNLFNKITRKTDCSFTEWRVKHQFTEKASKEASKEVREFAIKIDKKYRKASR